MRAPNVTKTIREWVLMVGGSVVFAIGINQLINPVHLMSGGLTGICMILAHFFHWSVGDLYFLLNIPLLIFGYRHIGRKFSIYTIISVIMLTIALDLIHFRVWTKDTFLCAIFGGILTGIGGAMILRAGGSSGGLDIVARIVAKYRNTPVGQFSMMVNSVIILVSAYLFNIQTAMFTLISIYTAAKTYDALLTHVGRITVMIVTNKGREMSKVITHSMVRGITSWDASGAYTDSQKEVLMCVVVNVQFPELKHLALSVDPDAFMAVIPTQLVVGRFVQIW